MKKVYFVLTLFLLASFQMFSQTAPVDTSWKKGGFFGLNFSQTSLSHWEQGGENSVALSSNTNLFANYIKGKADWQNSLDLAYSMVQTGTDKLKKGDDKIDFTSKYGRKFSDHWLYSVLLNFKSQFADGYNYPNDSMAISKFFSPAYVTLSLGFTYKPVDYFEVLLSPISTKFTFVNDAALSDAGAFGVDPGKTSRTEIGAYVNAKFKKDIATNVNLMTKLELFSAYSDSNEGKSSHNVDVNWEVMINMKINSFLNASVSTQMIYDEDVVARTQFKETIGVGLGLKF